MEDSLYQFPKLKIRWESVESLSKNRDSYMNQNKHVYAIFYKAEVACDVISSELLTVIVSEIFKGKINSRRR